jgi:cytochrome c peroxidase
MANNPEQLLVNLNQVEAYPELFAQAFPRLRRCIDHSQHHHRPGCLSELIDQP